MEGLSKPLSAKRNLSLPKMNNDINRRISGERISGNDRLLRGDATSLNGICASLSMFGLSRNEATIYIYLSRFGEQKAYSVSRSLSLQTTETYKILNKLEEKGLVYRILGKPVRFVAAPIDKALQNRIDADKQRILQLEEEKERILDKWLSVLSVAQNMEVPNDFIQILKGKHQLSIKIGAIIEESKAKF